VKKHRQNLNWEAK